MSFARLHRPGPKSALTKAAALSSAGPARSGPTVQRIAALQALADDTAAQRAAFPVIQRTVNTAADELLKQGVKEVKNSHMKGAFLKRHGLTANDKAAVQNALDALRANQPAAAAPVKVDMNDSTNWPTAGGMDETDAKIVAESLGWQLVSKEFRCSDPGHTPKGKVYSDGSTYYGADNTGHVGWGFKVWTVKKGTMLDYKGNISWNGKKWVHDARGT